MDRAVGQHDSARRIVTVDGNEAVASVAHRVTEVIAIYPITPSSPMITGTVTTMLSPRP